MIKDTQRRIIKLDESKKDIKLQNNSQKITLTYVFNIILS